MWRVVQPLFISICRAYPFFPHSENNKLKTKLVCKNTNSGKLVFLHSHFAVQSLSLSCFAFQRSLTRAFIGRRRGIFAERFMRRCSQAETDVVCLTSRKMATRKWPTRATWIPVWRKIPWSLPRSSRHQWAASSRWNRRVPIRRRDTELKYRSTTVNILTLSMP